MTISMKQYFLLNIVFCLSIITASACPKVLMAEDLSKYEDKSCEKKLSLNEFRAYAFKSSPLLAQIDKEYAEELAKAFETETYQNPELQVEQTFTHMNLAGDNDPQSQVSIGQPLRISNFGSRTRVAALIKKAGDAEKKAKLLEFSQQLIMRFKTLEAYQQIQSFIQEAEKRAVKKVAIIREGVKKGLFSQSDEKLFEGETYRLQAEAKSIASKIAKLQNDLSRSLGLVCAVSTIGGDSDDRREIPPLDELIKKSKQSEISERSRVDILNDLAKEQVKLAKLDSVPLITPRLLYQHTNDGGDFYGLGVSIPLPFWNQNQAQKIRSSAEAKLADMKLQMTDNGALNNQIKNVRIAAISAFEQADIYTDKVIPAFEEALISQEKLYLEGKGNVLQIWQILRTYNEVQTQGLEILLQAQTIRAELSILVGEEI